MNPNDTHHFTRQQKIEFVSKALSLENVRPFEVFSAVYCIDLISFGLQNDIAEAVRLGEKAMAETGESLPFEMAKAVKEYVLKNNQRYRESARLSGPLDLASVYAKNRSLINLDDPYWQEYMRKNYRSQD